MPILPHSCVTAVCDVCGHALTDSDSEGILHFPTAEAALEAVRAHRWPVTTGGQLVCNADDDEHTAELDALLPPAPVIQTPGQLDLDGREEN